MVCIENIPAIYYVRYGLTAHYAEKREGNPMMNLSAVIDEARSESRVWYDYDHQAWVEDGKYLRCGHPEGMNCRCWGRTHEGEAAPAKELSR